MALKPELEKYRKVLLEYREQIVGDSRNLQRDAQINSNSDSTRLKAPSHLADGGSDEQERTMLLERLSSSRATLQEIDDALDRIEEGSYGVCAHCGAEIGEGRLKIKPHADLCIECRRKEEDL